MVIILANVIDFLAAVLQTTSGAIKEKTKILLVQILQLLMQAVSMALLGGITGAVSNVLSCFRNYLCYKDKLTPVWKGILIAVSVAMTVILNDQGLLGVIPVTVCTVYILLMDMKDPVKFKILVTLTFIPWLIYHLVLGSYTGALCDAATIVTSCVTLWSMIKEQKTKA